MDEPSNSTTYDWFTFYLRTTYVCIILTIWLMDQPKQLYKLATRKVDATVDNFRVNSFFVKIHFLILFSGFIFFLINVRTNYITHIVGPFEAVLFGALVLGDMAIYYYHFIRKKPQLAAPAEQEAQLSGSELQNAMDEESNKKTIIIILWIITLVTIGKIIVSPSYVFFNNPRIIDRNPEVYLFLDNINNELLLYLLVLILFSQLFANKEFFPLSASFSFSSFDELVANFKNTFKIYVINIIFLTFITSKTKSNFLFLVYILCLSTSAANAYLAYRLLKQDGTLTYQPVSIDNFSGDRNSLSLEEERS